MALWAQPSPSLPAGADPVEAQKDGDGVLCSQPIEGTRESYGYIGACPKTLMSILRYYLIYSRAQPRVSLP